MIPKIGVLQGRLTPSNGRGIQFFPEVEGEWEDEFFAAKEAGLDSIELLLRPKGLRDHPLMSTEGRSKIKDLVDKTGVSVSSAHAYYEKDYGYEQDIFDITQAAGDFGIKTILLSFFKEKKLGNSYDETWGLAHKLLEKASFLAKERGIKFGIEAEHSGQTLIDFISHAKNPDVFGVYYDLGNQFACGFPVVDEILMLGDRIFGVHLKDRLKQEEGAPESKSVFFGEGITDFKGAFIALKDIGYDGDLIKQGARGEDGGEVELHKKYKQYIKAIVEDVWK